MTPDFSPAIYSIRRLLKSGKPGKHIYWRTTSRQTAHMMRKQYELTKPAVAPFVVVDNYGQIDEEPQG